jgi:hypothetical protein
LFSFVGGKKFSFVIILLPVFSSNSFLAFLATAPPVLPAFAFSISPEASMLSAICRVESSA